MDLTFTAEQRAFRAEVREWLQANVPTEDAGAERDFASMRAFDTAWQRRQFEGGWAGIAWPREYGGRGLSPVEQLIWYEEYARASGPYIRCCFVGVNHAGPTLIAAGTEEQKARYLPAILRGDEVWCQGFSEPEAGTDLASLRTRAVRDGDHYVVNGQKVWTSYANVADHCFLLVRTDPDAPKHQGITILLVPMSAPGLEVREINSLMGDHAFHELFFTDVRVPVADRLGDENGGWQIVMRTLAYERVGIPRYCRAQLEVDRLAAWAAEQGMADDPVVLDRLAAAEAACEAARLLVYRVVDERAKNVGDSGNVYVARAAMVQAERMVGDLGVDLMGGQGLVRGSIADDQYRDSLAAGIASGTYEVQLNLVARRHLDLAVR